MSAVVAVRLSKRRCMVCREDLLKGFFRHRTDPICIECTANVREQRRLLAQKYRQQEREALAAKYPWTQNFQKETEDA